MSFLLSSPPLLLPAAAGSGALAFPVVDWLANSSMVLLSGEAPGSVELWPTQVGGGGGLAGACMVEWALLLYGTLVGCAVDLATCATTAYPLCAAQ